MHSTGPTPADRRRLLDAWRRLGHDDRSRRDLEDIGRRILNRRRGGGYAVALTAWEITRQHLDTHEISRLADVKATAREYRALKKRAATIRRRLDAASRALAALHVRAAPRKWYQTRWTQHPAAVRALIERDPLLSLLNGAAFGLPAAGNPNKRRNGALVAALKAEGVTTRETADILHAIGWTAR